MTKHGHAILALFVVAIIVGAVYVMQNPNSIPLGNVGGNGAVGNNNPPPPPTTTSAYTGSVNLSAVATNFLNGTALTGGTNDAIVYFFKNADGSYQRAGTDSDGTESIVVGNNNYLYGEVTIPASQSWFVAWKQTVSSQSDSSVKTPSYLDPTSDGIYTYIFPLDISQVKAQGNPNFAPSYTWYPKFFGDQTFAINTPSSILNVGTGTKTSTIQWQLTIDANGGGDAFKAIQVKVNGTQATNEVAEEQSFIDIPATPTSDASRLYLSQMTASYDYSNSVSIFRKDYSYTVDGALLLTVPQTGSKVIQTPVTITSNMDVSTDGVCVKLQFEPISARNIAGTAINDSAELVAGASNGNECSISG